MLLWELYTLALVPYTVGRTIQDPYQLLELLEQGYRMPCPSLCPDDAYKLMLKCWNLDPKKRPTFATIVSELQTALDTESIAEASLV